MSTGPCYGCRHPDLEAGHCHGTGDLEPTGYFAGLTCTCECRPTPDPPPQETTP